MLLGPYIPRRRSTKTHHHRKIATFVVLRIVHDVNRAMHLAAPSEDHQPLSTAQTGRLRDFHASFIALLGYLATYSRDPLFHDDVNRNMYRAIEAMIGKYFA